MNYDENEPIINSLIDTDMYKIIMMQSVFHNHTDAIVKYTFKSNSNINLTPYTAEIQEEIKNLGELNFRENELLFLKKHPAIKNDFIQFLKVFKFDLNQINIKNENRKNSQKQLEIEVNGPCWANNSL